MNWNHFFKGFVQGIAIGVVIFIAFEMGQANRHSLPNFDKPIRPIVVNSAPHQRLWRYDVVWQTVWKDGNHSSYGSMFHDGISEYFTQYDWTNCCDFLDSNNPDCQPPIIMNVIPMGEVP